MAAEAAANTDRQSQLEDRVNYAELTGHFDRTRLREAVDRAISTAMRCPGASAFLAPGVDNMAGINCRASR